MGRRGRPHEGARAGDRQGLRRPGEPAPRLGPIGSRLQHAGHDGHRPEPRPQPGHRPGPDQAHRQRALRLGRLASVRGDVRADRARPQGRGLRRAVRQAEAARQGEARHGPQRRAAARDRRRVRADRQEEDRGGLPDRSVPAAGAGHPRRLRLLVREARARLPRVQQDPARPRYGREHRDDGLRQHGRGLGHRRRVHA